MLELNRRRFLAGCAGVGAVGALAASPVITWSDVVLAANDRPLQDNTGILVLVTLYGGNDGLNTVIPHSNDAYHDARPELAYGIDEVLELDDRFGLNPGMNGMAEMFRNESLAIVRGVGYPEPDRSHFRSMDIWQSASLDNSVTTGWVGRWLDATGADPLAALHLGPVIPPLARGENCSAAAFLSGARPSEDSTQLIAALSESHPRDSPAMAMVCDSYRAAARVNLELAPMFEEDGAPRLKLDKSLGSQLDVVAACIAADVPTRVYSVGIGGFDTHADERGTQEKLLQTLDTAITGFVKKLSGDKHAKDVIVMAYSEFGRRVAANASDGTDHGTAGPVFVIGDRVRGGFYGDDPSLTDLLHDDLKVSTDFRDVYHEILANGLRTDPEPVVGASRKNVGFLTA